MSETWVTDVTPTSANLRAKINPHGSNTTYRFEYLTEAAYEANLAATRDPFSGASLSPASGAGSVGNGSVVVAVVKNVGALAPSTSYRYRVRALNGEAPPVFGADHLLATSEPSSLHPPLDQRRYELVSPADKDGGAVGAPESIFGGGDFQAAADGESFTFSSPFSFGDAAAAPPASQYLATRAEASGWASQNLSPPFEAGGYGDEPDGAPFRLFSQDIARGLMLNGARCAIEVTCPPSYSLWDAGGFSALPTSAGLRLSGVTPDLDHLVFEAQGALLEWNGGSLEMLTSGPGATLAAQVGAIAEDGRRVYSYQLEDGPISLDEAGQPPKPLPGTTGVAAKFQAASADGRLAFFTVAGSLYRYDAGTEESTAIAAGVLGVLAVSPTGADVYYQDGSGLQRWHEGAGTITLVAGAAIATPSDYLPATATVRLSPDAQHLAFLSAAAIPPFDNTDANTGRPDTELYLYGPPPGGGATRLVCVSCNPTGERPRGSASIPGTLANGTAHLYRPRALAAGGNRVFFDSADRLLVSDTDSRPDVYEWEADGVGSCTRAPGCLGLISGARSDAGRFLDASASGDDVFFLTGESLLGADPGSIDVYDSRAGGGFPEPESPIPCIGDACQALPNEPEDPNPGTVVPNSGNPPVKYYKEHRKRHHHRKHRHHHHRRRVAQPGPSR